MIVLAAAAVSGPFGLLYAGGGDRTPNRLPVANDGAYLARTATLQLPRGRSTTTFPVRAPAAHAYDVMVDAPTATPIVLTMKIATGTGWTLNTAGRESCRSNAGRTVCELHFAQGGNPGGTWTGTVHDVSPESVLVHVDIAFNPHRGGYPG